MYRLRAAAAAPCGPQFVTQKVCVPHPVYGGADMYGDGVCSGDPHAHGYLLRNGSCFQNSSMHGYGHGPRGAEADGDLLCSVAHAEASQRELPGPGADLPDGAKQLHGLRSHLDRADAAMHRLGAFLRNPPGHARETHACRSRRRRRAASTRDIGKIGPFRVAVVAILARPARRCVAGCQTG